jgi:hypothetical protein
MGPSVGTGKTKHVSLVREAKDRTLSPVGDGNKHPVPTRFRSRQHPPKAIQDLPGIGFDIPSVEDPVQVVHAAVKRTARQPCHDLTSGSLFADRDLDIARSKRIVADIDSIRDGDRTLEPNRVQEHADQRLGFVIGKAEGKKWRRWSVSPWKGERDLCNAGSFQALAAVKRKQLTHEPRRNGARIPNCTGIRVQDQALLGFFTYRQDEIQRLGLFSLEALKCGRD